MDPKAVRRAELERETALNAAARKYATNARCKAAFDTVYGEKDSVFNRNEKQQQKYVAEVVCRAFLDDFKINVEQRDVLVRDEDAWILNGMSDRIAKIAIRWLYKPKATQNPTTRL